jgi:hypothetical protein
MAAGMSDFAEYLKSIPKRDFKAEPIYEKKTDSLIFYIRDERSYGKRINQLMTLFLSAVDDSLVGCEVKGVRRLLDRIGEFAIGVFSNDGKRVKLAILLAFALAPELEVKDSDELKGDLLELKDAAEDIEFESPELCEAAC